MNELTTHCFYCNQPVGQCVCGQGDTSNSTTIPALQANSYTFTVYGITTNPAVNNTYTNKDNNLQFNSLQKINKFHSFNKQIK